MSSRKGVRAELDGVDSYCVFAPSGSVILGMARSSSALYRGVNRSTALVALYLVLVVISWHSSRLRSASMGRKKRICSPELKL